MQVGGSSAEYWHMGDTTMRFVRVKSRMVSWGQNNLLMAHLVRQW
jgi:hypothetical protein